MTVAIQDHLAYRDFDPLRLRWADVDGDGEAEWVGLYSQPTDPPQLGAFVLDGEDWHDLRTPGKDEYGLGTSATFDLEIDDVNADGRTELLIWGRVEATTDLLHIFVWREERYDVLASFRGDAGVKLEDVDGDPLREIVARYDAGDGLAWEQIHTWDGTHYGWTWERYTWLYADYPHDYPVGNPAQVVISFYLAVADRNLLQAYDLFSSAAKASQPYDTWASGFDATLTVEVGSVRETDRAADTATVTGLARSFDNVDGYVIARLWDVSWILVQEGSTWRLEASSSEQLDRWEAPYFQ